MLRAGCQTGWCVLRQRFRPTRQQTTTLTPLTTLLKTGSRRLLAAEPHMSMNYDLTRINTLTASDPEFIRQQGEEARRALSDAVTGPADCPAGLARLRRVPQLNLAAFSRYSAVSARITGMTGTCALCSPGEVSPYWLLVLLSAGGSMVHTCAEAGATSLSGSTSLIRWQGCAGLTARRVPWQT